jgi:hypothetical protein
VGLKDRIRRLQRRAEGPVVSIPQTDGTVKRFPEGALREAFLEDVGRTTGRIGHDTPVHPLLVAARNSSDPTWPGSFFAGASAGEYRTEPVEDLSG